MQKQSIRTAMDLIELEIIQQAEQASPDRWDERYGQHLAAGLAPYAQEIAQLQAQCEATAGHVVQHGFTRCCICNAEVELR